jgi:hypothetical protein
MVDITQILRNLARSLEDVEKLASALVYFIGIGILISAMFDMKTMGVGQHADPDEKMKAFLKLVMGALLVYLPSTIAVFTQTFFGQGSVVSYDNYEPFGIYDVMRIIFRLAGIIWFARGSMMLYNIDAPSHKEKSYMSLTYIFAGILAINIDYAIAGVNYMVNQIIHWL